MIPVLTVGKPRERFAFNFPTPEEPECKGVDKINSRIIVIEDNIIFYPTILISLPLIYQNYQGLCRRYLVSPLDVFIR